MPDLSQRLQDALADRYRIERTLGRGGMATVFLAEDLKHRRRVAIKVLDPEVAAAIGPERFLREIETAASLQHPHILPLFDSGAADGLLYYVMPHVAGESLRDRLTREKQLPLEDALRIAREVADALSYAHSHGVVHRDVKPENILLQSGHAVVADFGIARAVAAAGGEKLTATGIAVGTPAYMSPEQAAGSRDLDGRSDLYSLGCVLYEMLAGQPPFTGPTAESLAHQHLNLTPRPVTELRPAVPAPVAAALQRALAKTPADRFNPVALFGEALGTVGTGTATTTAAAVVTTSARPRRGLALLGVAVAVVIIALLAVAASQRWGPFARWPGGASAAHPAKKDWILVAAFDGPADDSTLAGAIRDLMCAALDQSEIVSPVSDDQMRIALEKAGKPRDTRVDAQLARELAYRRSIRAVVEGRISRLGHGYALVVRVLDVDSVKVLLSVSAAAMSEDDLIPTVERITRRLRQGLGERRSALRATQESPLLAELTTPSFEAYRKYRQGVGFNLSSRDGRALAVAREALALDPGFAAAWDMMGMSYANFGYADSAAAAWRRALQLGSGMSEVWRLRVQANMAHTAGDYEAAVELLDRALELAPNRVGPNVARGNVLWSLGRYEEALASYRHAAKSCAFGTPQGLLVNMTEVLVSLGRLDEARQVAGELKLGPNQATELLLIALAEPDWARAESLATVVEANPSAGVWKCADGAYCSAAVQAASGRVRAAAASLHRAQALKATVDPRAPAEDVIPARLLLALASGNLKGVPEDVRNRDTSCVSMTVEAMWQAVAGDTARARRLLVAVKGHPARTLVQQGSLPTMVEAWLAARAGCWSESARMLAPVVPRNVLDNDAYRPLKRWLLAEAYERLGRPDSAAVYFELATALIGHRAALPSSRMIYSFAHRRCALLYARMGRLDEAQRHWDRFAATFTRPDPEMVPLVDEARTAIMSLRGMAESPAQRH